MADSLAAAFLQALGRERAARKRQRQRDIEALLHHVTDVRPVSGMLAMQSGSADEVIALMVDHGWTLEDGADLIGGKRIRYLRPPPGTFITNAVTPQGPIPLTITSTPSPPADITVEYRP